MSLSYDCRLCLSTCTNYKNLYSETGQTNEIYELAVKYFHPTYLQVDKLNPSDILCWKCWHTMNEFQQFQLSVFNAYQRLRTDGSKMERLLQKFDDDSKHGVVTDGNTQEDGDNIALSDKEFISDDSADNIDMPVPMKCKDEITNSKSDSEDCNSDVGDSIPSYRLIKKRQLDATVAQWRKTLECEVCGYAVPNYNTLLRHFKRSHPKEKCHIKCCNCKISGLAGVEKHARYHMGTSYIQCVICKATFIGYTRLEDHQKEKHPKKECFVWCCKQKFYGLMQYDKHLLDHLHPCKICGCPLTKYNLYYHMKSMHPKTSKANVRVKK